MDHAEEIARTPEGELKTVRQLGLEQADVETEWYHRCLDAFPPDEEEKEDHRQHVAAYRRAISLVKQITEKDSSLAT